MPQSPECFVFFYPWLRTSTLQKPFTINLAACNSVPRFFLWDNHRNQWPNWSLQYFSGASPQGGKQLQLATWTAENTKSATKTEDKNRLKHVAEDIIDLEDCSPHEQPAASQQQIKHKHYMPRKSMIQRCWVRHFIDAAQKSKSTANGGLISCQ